MNTTDFYINFGGFYYSHYSDLIDSIIESDLSEGHLTEYQADYLIDYLKVYSDLSIDIFDRIIEYSVDFLAELEIFIDASQFKFNFLKSPKYYNYSTDKIDATFEGEIKTLYKLISIPDFVNFVNETSKSYMGFHSFYEGIKNVLTEDHIFLEYVFNWILSQNDLLNFILYNGVGLHECAFNCIYNNLKSE